MAFGAPCAEPSAEGWNVIWTSRQTKGEGDAVAALGELRWLRVLVIMGMAPAIALAQDAGGETAGPISGLVAGSRIRRRRLFLHRSFLDREWGDGTASPSTFNPTDFDPGAMDESNPRCGREICGVVAKHHDGFCLWPTEQTDYSVKSSPWRGGKGDVVGDVARAARKYGLKFGVYLSPWDRHEPRYKDAAAYDNYYNAELEELASHHGDLVEFWLDGAGSQGHVYDFKNIETPAHISPIRWSLPTPGCLNMATRAGSVPKRVMWITRTERHRTVTISLLAPRRSRHAAEKSALVLASQRRNLAEEPE